ncbi:MAG TPA: RluA family pseudouridine synthase [Caldilineaceae bacterium]|nr:RluA family pseudouridine synthase [Caldilineaceae bacterium]
MAQSLAAASQTLYAGAEDAGERLDRWLAAHFPDHSRSEIQRWIKEGDVRVNGAPARSSHRLAAGEMVELALPERSVDTGPEAEAIPLAILYEDDDLLVVDKPAGMVVHPAPGHETGTLVNAILHHCPNLPGVGGERRPGIVHRLDKDTSGVMVVAKHDRALRFLQAQFKERAVHKEYIALVEGKLTPQSGRIVAPIGRHPVDRKRQAVLAEVDKARTAETEYTVEGVYSAPVSNDQGLALFSLVRAHPITGRTHQIRVHLAWRGHPIVGDPIYGLRRARLRIPRLFLHAARLCLRLPGGERREFIAPLPPDLQAVLDALEEANKGS